MGRGSEKEEEDFGGGWVALWEREKEAQKSRRIGTGVEEGRGGEGGVRNKVELG